MRVDYAKLSLAGNRPENQDRVEVVSHEDSLLLVVVDGMGGHAHGARAAEVTVGTLKECFGELPTPLLDPQGFLTLALARAHDRTGRTLPREPDAGVPDPRLRRLLELTIAS